MPARSLQRSRAGVWRKMDSHDRPDTLFSFIAAYFLAALALLYLSHSLPRLLPGDFVTAMYSQSHVALSAELETSHRASAAAVINQDFLGYLKQFIMLDWGTSLTYREPVNKLIFSALPWTLLLLGLAHIASMALGFIAGCEAAWRKGGSFDRIHVSVMTIMEGIPEIGSGILLLLVFSLSLGWFPAAGAETVYGGMEGLEWLLDVAHHLALPLLTLILAYLPSNFLLSRASMLFAINTPYMLTARAKGLSPLRRRYMHAARNALIPVATRFAVRLASLLTGAVVVEAIHSYPGIGTLLFNAIGMRDLPLITGIVMFSSLAMLSATFALEFVYRALDPRLKK